MAIKRERQVLCLYSNEWVPMGRVRTRCPRCGAVIDGKPDSDEYAAHLIRTVLRETGK